MAAAPQSGFIACGTDLDAPAVAQHVQRLFGTQGYVILSKVTDVQFVALAQLALAAEISAYDEGRVFAPIAELRWRRTATGRFATLLLTEDQGRLPSTWQRLGTCWQAHSAEKPITLWGTRQEGWPHWTEVRLPRPLSYPVAKTAGNVCLAWIAYRDAQDTTRFIRFKEVY